MTDTPTLFRKILVAMDFSEPADAALCRAIDLAGPGGSEVTVAHVLENVAGAVAGTSFEAHWRIPPEDLHRAEAKLRRRAEERLAHVLAPYQGGAIPVRSEVLVGVPFVELTRLVQKGGHDLVLVGTSGISALKRVLVGSTAERLVRKCPCPVWVVKPRHTGPLRSVLAPVDFTDVSGKCLELAAALARQTGADLHVVHVITPADDEVVQLPEDVARLDVRLQRREVRQAAGRVMSEFVQKHVPGEYEVEERVSVGVPWKGINLVAKRVNADLIVMGSVGRTGLPGFIIGNTAEKVLRHCDRPLLAVKPDGFVSPVQAG